MNDVQKCETVRNVAEAHETLSPCGWRPMFFSLLTPQQPVETTLVAKFKHDEEITRGQVSATEEHDESRMPSFGQKRYFSIFRK